MSSSLEPDFVVVRFNDPLLFYSTRGNVIAQENRVISQSIPRQLEQGQATEFLESFVDVARASAQTVILSNFVLNAFITAALQQVWSMINTQ